MHKKLNMPPLCFKRRNLYEIWASWNAFFETIKQPVKTIASELNLSFYGVKVHLEAGLSLEMVYLKNNEFILTKTGYFILRDKKNQYQHGFYPRRKLPSDESS